MSKPLCLIVDDEPDILELFVMTLEQLKIKCYTATTLNEAKEYLLAKTFDLCLTDMRLGDDNGIDLVAMIGQHYPHTPVAMITAHGNVESAVHALKAGAFDFISKPVDLNELRNLVNSALTLSSQATKTNLNKPPAITHTKENDKVLFSKLIGQSQVMKSVREQIKKLARSQAPIYIKGESGTGKEVVARMIHGLGTRADKPFIPVNCGAIPSELMESEFFGHKKGSFSGAYNDRQGFFQVAQGGTLFLDEIADLPLAMQVKLLRAIQEKRIRSIGESKETTVDIRILSATHRDLHELVKQGKFRQDLFYRINVIELFIPPLCQRIEDLPDLVAKILKDLNSNTTRNQFFVSDEVLQVLKRYSFPGNIRELENILERATTLCDENKIQLEHLQLPEDEALFVNNYQAKDSLNPLLDNVERQTILNALQRTKGNKTKAAELLGIGFGALRYRLQKFKIIS
ncbi:MAG: sigma-54-dependent Fis family transcriptional regulator [Thiomargarita sp.]|nr:sigma-54-dependent Fis family transcriptional regulator [Thiomargarita sp.]